MSLPILFLGMFACCMVQPFSSCANWDQLKELPSPCVVCAGVSRTVEVKKRTQPWVEPSLHSQDKIHLGIPFGLLTLPWEDGIEASRSQSWESHIHLYFSAGGMRGWILCQFMSTTKHVATLFKSDVTLWGEVGWSSATLTDHLSFVLNFRTKFSCPHTSTWSHFKWFSCILLDFQCQTYRTTISPAPF